MQCSVSLLCFLSEEGNYLTSSLVFIRSLLRVQKSSSAWTAAAQVRQKNMEPLKTVKQEGESSSLPGVEAQLSAVTHIYNWAGCHITVSVCVERRGCVCQSLCQKMTHFLPTGENGFLVKLSNFPTNTL